jgi:flagellar basal body-associated protein FliL
MSEILVFVVLVAVLAAVVTVYAIWHAKSVAAKLDAANHAVTGAFNAAASDVKAVASAADEVVSNTKSAAETVAMAAQDVAGVVKK